MNMVYKENKLYIELMGSVTKRDVGIMKDRLFSVLNSYTINDIIINVDGIFGLKRDIFNEFLEEYHTKYKGNVTINNK